ncbi:D-alanyl-D-alanine carboxypeptidase family protein [Pseudidiomarina terrestris]|uniref:D-alanyl-D-alanine carboxypeptidase family protein n=1 Tax=Pseudidiomarina terrestris TaxID=2820060 RepID=UPI00264F1CDD|nr:MULTISPECIES: D-alanyl-D-alanine carboxypeptidase family protein [unclassified Pseudidiomarina]MDN7127833.1 D-alanyl-D-alanine carboxypeptidase [Pseudidiomarina sp. 1APR75-33.1]MDN7134797.1 D-alanyl-D-alanine carboxypeptidase [Pseudidiomarina sp. 1ASP75-5]MDN7137475.1 D-alanyl-D-alanine carboxypeptidase [Pseudidiomarina sp. 1ASP75-14]MEA3587415.1 D-alanyl-D-alanine carboxypeptidase [Pseudidiomarina sp. 1APP75-27a]
MNSVFKQLIRTVALLAGATAFAAQAAIIPPPPQVNAKGYILMDYTTGYVIAEGNADDQLAPASLTKMMTSYIIGREIQDGRIHPTDLVTVSENAWAKNFPESSKMFIEVGKQISVADLNRGIIISSGNDACVAMAEHIAGSESAFADLMNNYAYELGMTNTHFANSHGLPDPEQYTSPRDMALLGAALIRDVPQEYAIYSEKEFTFNSIKQYNRNSLLWDASMNVDGIKTGHTQEAGYSLVTSAVEDNTRLVAVVMGTSSEQARKIESKKLLNYGFRYYETVQAYTAGDRFVDQRVWGGEQDTVQLGIANDAVITLPRGQRENLKASIELNAELEAPVAKGVEVGTVSIQLADETIASYPLVTLNDVAEGGLFKQLTDWVVRKFNEE